MNLIQIIILCSCTHDVIVTLYSHVQVKTRESMYLDMLLWGNAWTIIT